MQKMARTSLSTDPPVIEKPTLRELSPYSSSATVEWEIGMKVDGFSVLSYMDGQQPKESTTKNPIFNIDIQPACSYNIQVACIIQNMTGRYSKILHFTTAPKGPYNLEVTPGIKSPSTSLTVKYQDDDRDGKKYHIVAESPDHKKEKTTEKLIETIDGLQPGAWYDVRVTGSKEEVKGRPCILEGIATFPGQVQELRRHGDAVYPTSQAIAWKPIPGASSYIIKCRRLDKSYETHKTDDTEFTLQKLDSGQEYTATVAAKNASGTGEFSEPLLFATRTQPPSRFIVTPDKDDPSTAVQIKIGDNETHDDRKYGILIKPISDGRRIKDIEKTIDRNQYTISNLIAGTQYIAYVWSLVPGAPNRNSKRIRSEEFWTAPKPVRGLDCSKESPTSVHVKWDPSQGTVSCMVTIKRDGSEPEIRPTEKSWIYLKDLQLHSKYKVTVRAQNDGGESKESPAVFFETPLHTPKAVVVKPCKHNPTKAIIVHVTEPDVPAQRYMLNIISLRASDQPIVVPMYICRQEATTGKTVEDLEPGESYQVSVCSVHNRRGLSSEEVFSEVIQTRLPPLRVVHSKLANYKHKFSWNPLNDVLEYKLKWRIEHDEEWHTKTVDATEATEKVLHDLKPGYNFEVKVTAYNEAGEGDSSQIIRFTTVPGAPSDIQYEISSTCEVTFTCEKVNGATHYAFNILGERYTSDEPQLTHVHDAETVMIIATVAAGNISGFGPPSRKIEFRQSLLHVQKKFIQFAKTKLAKEQFIAPIFTDVSTNDPHYGFGTSDFHIENGETVLILGGHFTGKTACCSYYLQALKEEELGIFLDMEEYQQKSDMSIEALLKSAITDISNDEMTFLFGWIKKHSDKVVIVIDNFSLPSTYVGKRVSYGNTDTYQNLFYNLAKLNREILPDSHILCATSQNHLQQLIPPTLTLRIDGFCNDEICSMKMDINGESIRLPKHQEYFCINPSYCKAILHLLKASDKTVDMESHASIFAKALTESIKRYPEVKQQKKLKEILTDVKNVPDTLRTTKIDLDKAPKKSKSSTSSTTQDDSGITDSASIATLSVQETETRHTCASLQDSITKALYLAFVCGLNNFKDRFRKKRTGFSKDDKRIVLGNNAKIYVMACGFLREGTAELLNQLFEKVDQSFKTKRNERKHPIREKLKFIKTYISENLSEIQKQLTVDSRELLNWCDIITEVDLNGTWKNNPIKIDKKHFRDKGASEQIISFLQNVRQSAYDFVQYPTAISEDDTRIKEISEAVDNNSNIRNRTIHYYEENFLRGALARASLNLKSNTPIINNPRKSSNNGASEVFVPGTSTCTLEKPADGSVVEENATASPSLLDNAEKDDEQHGEQNREVNSGGEKLI